MRKWYPSNREKVKKRVRAWVVANLERVAQYKAQRYMQNREEIRAAAKAWKASNPERHAASLAVLRAKRAANPELHRVDVKLWRLSNPEKLRVARQRYTARRRSALGNVTVREWTEILDYFGHRCAYCLGSSGPLTQDHMIPVSQGGEHIAANVVPACGPCNSRKNVKTPLQWLVGLTFALLLLFLPTMGSAETRNYVKGATVQMNSAQMAANLDSALGITGTRVTVGITPTLVVVSHPSLTGANDAAVNAAISSYVFDALYDSRAIAVTTISKGNQGTPGTPTDNVSLVQRAAAAVLVDEINLLRQWNSGLASCVAGAATLAALKTCVATLPALPDRTLSQAATAIQGKITSGGAD